MLTEFMLDRQGCPIHYWLMGDPSRPLIVLTHGAGADHRTFDAQLPMLLEHYRVLTWDMRGHGQSRPLGEPFTLPAPPTICWRFSIKLTRQLPSSSSHSMGGSVTQEIVYQHPERARALVIIDSTCNTLPISAAERLSVAITPLIFKLLPYEPLKSKVRKPAAFGPTYSSMSTTR
ncbi:MAG: alpha/beta fold hydrolase [Anaerolineae bacterium]